MLEGTGTHWVNGASAGLAAGDLLWIRPPDAHAVCARAGERLHFINVAFAAGVWAEFRGVADLAPAAQAWQDAPLPPVRRLAPAEREACAADFGRALRAFHGRPSRLDLVRFWADVLPLLLPDRAGVVLGGGRAAPVAGAGVSGDGRSAHLQEGVARLVELSGVGSAHMSRVLKSYTGQTPTEWVNALRLRRAATLLLTTSQDIAEIALDCGFENLSYFYRRFGQAYGRPPRAFRWECRGGTSCPAGEIAGKISGKAAGRRSAREHLPRVRRFFGGRRGEVGERLVEVLAGEDAAGVFGRFGQADERLQPGLVDGGLDVGAGIAVGAGGEVIQIDVVGQARTGRGEGEQGAAGGQVRQGDLDLAGQPPAPEQGGVEHVAAVGGADHEDAPIFDQAVHLVQELVDDLVAVLVDAAGAGRQQGVDLVQKDDGGGLGAGLVEEALDGFLAFAEPHGVDLGGDWSR